MPYHRRSLSILIILLPLVAIYCNTEKFNAQGGSDYLNWSDTVSFVGIKKCSTCHQKEYAQFMTTGMGQSFDKATRYKSAAKFDTSALVYDRISNFYYKPFWRRDSFFILEFRLLGGDTTHKREEYISYIIGSGQHTNSHIVNINGLLYQAPITYYTQKGKWGMAPGFEGENNSRFERKIGHECMTCHNGLPDFISGSENKYTKVLTGIDCERCHGAGSVHVREMEAERVIDTSKFLDLSIVNPKDLTIAKQMSLCQRCHLQGIAILADNKTFADFKVGKDLAEVVNVFLPKYRGGEDKFIMASHAERLHASKCFTESKLISCVTCHNPHINVQTVGVRRFNVTCIRCHTKNENCKEEISARAKKQDNCVLCHMPASSSIDIPHVAITDHKIAVPIVASEVKESKRKFVGLNCFTDDDPSNEVIAEGFVKLYEAYITDETLLDSAVFYLNKKGTDQQKTVDLMIHIYFLQNDYLNVLNWAKKMVLKSITKPWTSYRIGEAYYQNRDYKTALSYYEHALTLKPYNLEYLNKLGSTYLMLGNVVKAKEVFEAAVKQNPKFVAAISNLGFVQLKMGMVDEAKQMYIKAIGLNPDYEQGLMNMAGLHLLRKQKVEAKKILIKVLEINPANGKAKDILNQINRL